MISLEDGEFVTFTITRNGKTISINNDSSWSLFVYPKTNQNDEIPSKKHFIEEYFELKEQVRQLTNKYFKKNRSSK